VIALALSARGAHCSVKGMHAVSDGVGKHTLSLQTEEPAVVAAAAVATVLRAV
jgi:hypothetical protein